MKIEKILCPTAESGRNVHGKFAIVQIMNWCLSSTKQYYIFLRFWSASDVGTENNIYFLMLKTLFIIIFTYNFIYVEIKLVFETTFSGTP